MKLILEVLQLSTIFLQERNIDRPRRSAEELMAHVLNCKRMDLYLKFDQPIEEKELEILREYLKRMGKGEPIEYIIGEVEFLDCKIRVDQRVLIPRPETELLAVTVIKELKGMELAGKSLWDVCTGSGYLGIALKKAFPELSVTLSDISEGALELAAENARLNGVEVELLKGDLFAPFGTRKADFILCNPPYVSESEYFTLDSSVRDFEPRLAIVGGEKGTEIYERLSQNLLRYLQPKGRVYLEIGSSQGEAMKQIFSKEFWSRAELQKDWSGHPRFFLLEKQEFLDYPISLN